MIPFDLALTLLSKEKYPEVKICSSSAYWMTLHLLYVEMLRNKDIVKINNIPQEEKERYWRIASKAIGEVKNEGDLWNYLEKKQHKRWVKGCICQALYVYDQLKQ